jgi:hypothetical protein
VKQIFKAGGIYFVLVFAVGFVLGTIRTLWAVPRLGVRTAELMEAPIMFGVSILMARWVVAQLVRGFTRSLLVLVGRASPSAGNRSMRNGVVRRLRSSKIVR